MAAHKFLKNSFVDPGFKADARAHYMGQRLDSALYGNKVGELNKLRETSRWKDRRMALADSLINSPDKKFWGKSLTQEQQKQALGPEQYTDWASITGGLPGNRVSKNKFYAADSVQSLRAGENDPNASLWGIRSSSSMEPAERRLKTPRYEYVSRKTYNPNNVGNEYATTITANKRKSGGLLRGKKL